MSESISWTGKSWNVTAGLCDRRWMWAHQKKEIKRWWPGNLHWRECEPVFPILCAGSSKDECGWGWKLMLGEFNKLLKSSRVVERMFRGCKIPNSDWIQALACLVLAVLWMHTWPFAIQVAQDTKENIGKGNISRALWYWGFVPSVTLASSGHNTSHSS